ncbi:MAG: hypothetical protein E5Y01_16325 [Mesorhizobium sp.]|uniref:hypothetical protein n=1 Tax=Mesorhizobium sp. TaxID=1871066 RepID=UPI0011F82958|nr:hypothetical protein [Mesorhizobium sp.]TJV51152.1 MAG: hypothetical protein E5Y01_16325 [Mesorhizobium sp.]
MRSFLTVTSPAADRTLLTIAEMCAAAGVTGNGSDADLQAMEAQNAASIMAECDIAIGAGAPPTLRKETLTETIYQAYGESLILARRHEIAINSIVEDGVTLLNTDFQVDPESGVVTKLCDDYPVCWSAKKIVVVYDAGFETVPGDLKKVAADFLRSTWLEKSRDPLVKSERVKVEGVDETEKQFWVGSVPGQSNEGAVPDIVAGQLTRFRNYRV